MARSMPEAPKTWILTGSAEHVDATREPGFRPIDRLRAAAGAPA
jgi:hypothetical protein